MLARVAWRRVAWRRLTRSQLGREQIRCVSTTLNTEEFQSLDQWIASPKRFSLNGSLGSDHLSDLFITLPTRDGSRKPFEAPRISTDLPYGHHLAFFHTRRAETLLRADGTDDDASPPAPFLRRMWAGGRIKWEANNPLLIGQKATATSTITSAQKKGFDKASPKVFITQTIALNVEGVAKPSIIEERDHVYIPESAEKGHRTPRAVTDIPASVDFSFQYRPTPITLFRFSALTFNAHHIHLDKAYTQRVEGYPERLVHGPLTALMLLETVVFNQPKVQIQSFEYRATNPLFVNRNLTINGVWTSASVAKLWCVDEDGVVGMTGLVNVL